MVLNRKQKQSRKRFTNARKQYSKRVQRGIQRGGVSTACVYDGATGNDMLVRNPGVNLHNTNPQASLDLDNKFMSYGGAVPLGSNILQGGASSKCGDEGSNNGVAKTETFKQYLDNLSSKYTLSGGALNTPEGSTASPMNVSTDESMMNTSMMNTSGMPADASMMNTSFEAMPSPKPMPEAMATEAGPSDVAMPPPTMTNSTTAQPTSNTTPATAEMGDMMGGGFTTDPSEFIAGLPVYKAYDDCCPPAIVNGGLQFGAPDQPVCGLGAIKGGGRRKHRQQRSKKHNRNSKKHNRNSRNNKNNNRRQATKRNHNNKNNNRRHNRTQRGGSDWVYSARQSTPAPMSEAFNGPAGVFKYPDDMMSRSFDESQPNYSVNAI